MTQCFRGVAAAVPEDSATGWAALMRALARARPSEVPPGRARAARRRCSAS
ncbi:hypothetical protein [Nannocystis pusilla]|uniref:hypothetical protein n=1 Tax=Nannocystis pusilla TaxID=889268 RepID=UPI003B7EE42E